VNVIRPPRRCEDENEQTIREHPRQDQVRPEHLVVVVLLGGGVTVLLHFVRSDLELLNRLVVDSVDVLALIRHLHLHHLLAILGDGLGTTQVTVVAIITFRSP